MATMRADTTYPAVLLSSLDWDRNRLREGHAHGGRGSKWFVVVVVVVVVATMHNMVETPAMKDQRVSKQT
jgi:hypothetical protein